MDRNRSLKTAFFCLLITIIGGCTTSGGIADYKKSTTVPPLEVPPDLIGSTHITEENVIPETTTFSNYRNRSERTTGESSQKVKVLPFSKKVQIKRDGNLRWLELQGDPATYWTKIKRFWQENGFILKYENSAIGIMETKWVENHADIPQEGIRKLLSKALGMLYSLPTRDKFRVRLERNAGVTEVYLTHRGVEEIARGNHYTWQNRPSDPEIEAEMLNRLMVFLGIEKKQADVLLTKAEKKKSVLRAKLVYAKDKQVNLIVKENFARTWRRTGLALDRLRFTLEDRDRSRGLYFIRYIDPDTDDDEGFFTKFFSSNKSAKNNQKYRIHLVDESSTTRIVILDSEGKSSEVKTGKRILKLLYDQLK
jgi:outer membrane protein assembly factor BamC